MEIPIGRTASIAAETIPGVTQLEEVISDRSSAPMHPVYQGLLANESSPEAPGGVGLRLRE